VLKSHYKSFKKFNDLTLVKRVYNRFGLFANGRFSALSRYDRLSNLIKKSSGINFRIENFEDKVKTLKKVEKFKAKKDLKNYFFRSY